MRMHGQVLLSLFIRNGITLYAFFCILVFILKNIFFNSSSNDHSCNSFFIIDLISYHVDIS